MSAYVFDTSGIVKRYVWEAGTDWVRASTDPAAGHRIYVARITVVEVASAISRRRRGGGLSAADAAVVLAEFRRDLSDAYLVIEVTSSLLDAAADAAEAHGLRAYDAVQLAAAFEMHQQRSALGLAPLILVTADRALFAAAAAAGLRVEDPNHH
jgi:hypothetical protein